MLHPSIEPYAIGGMSSAQSALRERLEAVFIGLGSIGQRQLQLWHNLTGECPWAVRSGHGPELPPHTYQPATSVQEAVNSGAKVAFICNPTSEHIASALECARLGLALFLEKPIGNSLEGWKELKTLLIDGPMISYVAYPLRFHPLLQRCRALIANHELGDVLSFSAICSSYLPDWRPGSNYRNCYSAQKRLCGGALLDLSHELDYLAWLFGPYKITTARLERISDLKIDTEDHVDLLLRFASGVPGRVHLDYYRRDAQRTLDIVAAEGSATADLIS